MTSAKWPPFGRRPVTALALLAGACSVLPCAAQQAAAPAAAPAAAGDSSDAVTEELIRVLQQRNALSKDEANTLIDKLRKRPAQPAAANAAPSPPAAAAPAATAAAPSTAPSAAAAEGTAAAASKPKGDVRVMYIPESEKQRIRDEVKQEVLTQAKAENWAQPFALPEWVKHISFNGDVMVRQEFDFYNAGNYPAVNYYAVNSGSPIDVNPNDSNTTFPPLLDTTQDRELPRFRFRLGMQATVSDTLDVGLRLATGTDTNPVVTDQPYPPDSNRMYFMLDQGYIHYHPLGALSVWAGRVPNPWLFTNIVWDDDLNFDGFTLQSRFDAGKGFTPFVTLGAYSVENTTYNLSANGYNDQPSRDKWLFGTQLGADWKLRDDLTASGAMAYYYYYEVSGVPSDPCAPTSATVVCDTDVSRPLFLQKGNTLFPLRNPSLTTGSQEPQYQYFGLASQFRELDGLLRFDARLSGNLHWLVEGEYVTNLGFNAARIKLLNPVTNLNSSTGEYSGGHTALHLMTQVGYPVIRERGEWSLVGGYKRIESDAVLDAFVDSTFHDGGTNAKGYYVQGNIGFTHNSWFDVRWFSAAQVSGPPLAIDILQLDVNARF